jgi:hypothetical protein
VTTTKQPVRRIVAPNDGEGSAGVDFGLQRRHLGGDELFGRLRLVGDHRDLQLGTNLDPSLLHHDAAGIPEAQHDGVRETQAAIDVAGDQQRSDVVGQRRAVEFYEKGCRTGHVSLR